MKDEPPKKGMVVPSENLDKKKGKYKAGKDNSDDRSSSKNSREGKLTVCDCFRLYIVASVLLQFFFMF